VIAKAHCRRCSVSTLHIEDTSGAFVLVCVRCGIAQRPGIGTEGYVTCLKAAQRAGHVTRSEVRRALFAHGVMLRAAIPPPPSDPRPRTQTESLQPWLEIRAACELCLSEAAEIETVIGGLGKRVCRHCWEMYGLRSLADEDDPACPGESRGLIGGGTDSIPMSHVAEQLSLLGDQAGDHR
jgi:hypothetical protein